MKRKRSTRTTTKKEAGHNLEIESQCISVTEVNGQELDVGDRKMAGKKGQVVQLQLEVDTEEEWEKLLLKDGLIVVDVYSEWCGPCLAMVGTLKKIKLEIGGDFLTFAIAKSDSIEVLTRFRKQSEPTWMFIAGGQLVNLMFGADAPKLTNLIINEISKEKAVQKGEATREALPFDELTPEEKVRQSEREQRRLAAKAQEEAIEAAARAAAYRRELRNLMKYIKSYTVILLMPYLYENGTAEAWQKLIEELGPMGYSVQDEESLELESSLASELIYGGTQEVSEEFNEQLKFGKTIAKLVLYQPPEVPEIVQPGPDEKDAEKEPDILAAESDAIFGTVRVIYGCHPSDREEELLTSDPESLEANYRKAIDIPAFWTPLTPSEKANAIMKLFPKFAEKYKLPLPQTLPPIITIIFDANKSPEVNEMMQNYPDEVITTGYFTGPDPSSAKILAICREQYDQLHLKQEGETLVVVVSRRRSEPLLSFCQLGPIYISDNTDDGKNDYEAFFPQEEEETGEELLPEEPEKTSTLHVTIPQCGGNEDQVSEYTCEKAAMVAPEYDEVSGLPATSDKVRSLEVEKAEMSTEVVAKVEG